MPSTIWSSATGVADFFKQVLNLPFYGALTFTLTYTALVTPLAILLGFSIALAVNAIPRFLRGPAIFFSLLPMIVTPLVGALILFWMVDARGILGVAMIQAMLAGLGMLAAGVPAAGLWALVGLLLSTIQLGVLPIMVPATIYLFYTASTTTAVLFLIWTLFVGTIDNILKPILLGRGISVPMLVIFVGAIGGFIAQGIIGLFVGAVVLALGYELLLAWLQDGELVTEPGSEGHRNLEDH
jgi:hypothetical protein